MAGSTARGASHWYYGTSEAEGPYRGFVYATKTAIPSMRAISCPSRVRAPTPQAWRVSARAGSAGSAGKTAETSAESVLFLNEP